MVGQLNEKQEKFAQAYVLYRNATEAAKAAGYSDRSAYNQGSRLLKSEAVQQAAQGKWEVDKRANISPDTTFVTGGTCSAMRAIGMTHILGFRNFHLFGFDCNIPNVTPEMEKEETEDGKKKYLKVETNGVHFWTTGELLAMAQDCEKVFNDPGLEGVLCYHGKDTMVADLWDIKVEQETRPQFKGYYDD